MGPKSYPKGVHVEQMRRLYAQNCYSSLTSCSKSISKIPGSETLYSVFLLSAALSSVHGYARVHSSIYIYMPAVLGKQAQIDDIC